MSQTDGASSEAANAAADSEFVFIILLADWGGRLEGSVLRADRDLVGMLEVEGAKYREASAVERGLAGFIV